MPSRRAFLTVASLSLIARRPVFAAALPVVTVYKDPGCKCCTLWVEHLSKNGFVTTVHDSLNMDEVKRTLGVPDKMQSCHTAVVGKYVVEGHVPADVIKSFLKDAPAFVGIAAPGMPNGSPGMEGGTPDHYDIIAFNRTGATKVYAKR